ncbi:hypothetical protein JCM10207_003992 [Rhodosporidiobolus poonsookiae]
MVYIPFLSNTSLVGSPAYASEAVVSSGSGVLFARSTIAALSSLLVQSELPALTYPSDITRGIVPKNCHSHNDYWRDVPLLDAISWGFKSVEADIHLVDGQLLVGHKADSLTPDRTLQSLYIDPLLEIIKLRNPYPLEYRGKPFYWTPIYDNHSSGTPFQLLLDYKTNGTELHAAVIEALQPLRELQGVLEYHDSEDDYEAPPGWDPLPPNPNTRHSGLILVTCTGNCPLEAVEAQQPRRDVFFDAPLLELGNSTYHYGNTGMYSAPWHSVPGKWDGEFENGEGTKLGKVRELLSGAGEGAGPVRVWDTPGWPSYRRSEVWRGLLRAGEGMRGSVILANADDLEACSNL